VGLYAGEELVALMTFGVRKITGRKTLELMRFASMCGTRVVGGASKLLAHFLREYDLTGHETLVSYADVRWSGLDASMYSNLGFELVGRSAPGYWYFRPNSDTDVRLHRYAFRKGRLHERLGDAYDASLSEKENMKKAGYLRVYDCGNLVFERRI
jgi:hypothetical protein